jgi:hypothetical protein
VFRALSFGVFCALIPLADLVTGVEVVYALTGAICGALGLWALALHHVQRVGDMAFDLVLHTKTMFVDPDAGGEVVCCTDGGDLRGTGTMGPGTPSRPTGKPLWVGSVPYDLVLHHADT